MITLNEIRLRHDNHTSPTQAEREFLLNCIKELEAQLDEVEAHVASAAAKGLQPRAAVITAIINKEEK